MVGQCSLGSYFELEGAPDEVYSFRDADDFIVVVSIVRSIVVIVIVPSSVVVGLVWIIIITTVINAVIIVITVAATIKFMHYNWSIHSALWLARLVGL